MAVRAIEVWRVMRFWKHAPDNPPNGTGWLVVGLGNPGTRYRATRHNIGFMAVEALARRHGLAFKGSKNRADIASGIIAGKTVVLAEPLTYMNESGLAVSRLMDYYRMPVDQLLVICDDLDLPFGTLRFRQGGTSGGNNGLKSIIQTLGTSEFSRLRLGVGRPERTAVQHVLQRFPTEQQRLLPGLLDVSADAVEVFLRDGINFAMNRFNREWVGEIAVT